MSKVEDFLTALEEQEIINAIQIAEKNTSGEIRIHIENTTSKDTFDRALEVFQLLKIYNTKDSNGVLVYIAVKDRALVILGDKGINEVVPHDFWDCTKDAMVAQFKNGNFKQGLIDGILRAGEQLKKFFPWQDNDHNELSDTISKG